MFKKLLALFTLSVALIQPVYANETDDVANKLEKFIDSVTTKYNQGEKELFLNLEKELKELLEKSDNGEGIFVYHYILSEIYIKTDQYKKSKPHLEALIELSKKEGKKDADLTAEYFKLALVLLDDGNRTKAKHYAGLTCDNGEQLGCELYRDLNK